MTLSRRTHRVLGLVLLLPICGWALTGFVFFIKPGYAAAYSGLRVHLYPLEGASVPPPQADWLDLRMLRTVLGDHLLVRGANGPLHLDPATLAARELPDETAIRSLIGEAIAKEHGRYGDIASVTRTPGESPSASIKTTTGIDIELDWTTLGLQQSGRDTRRIDALYRIHYLQWTGVKTVDRIVGGVGLASLIVLAILGLRLALGGRRAGALS